MRTIPLLCLIHLTTLAYAADRMIPHITNPDGGFSTRILLVNSDEQPQDYNLLAYDSAGEMTAQVQGTLAGGVTLARDAVDWFAGADAARVRIEAADSLKVFAD